MQGALGVCVCGVLRQQDRWLPWQCWPIQAGCPMRASEAAVSATHPKAAPWDDETLAAWFARSMNLHAAHLGAVSCEGGTN